MNIVMLGPPGVGKGTQAARLAVKQRVPHISSGDLFRHLAHSHTAISTQLKSYMDHGDYVPDGLTIEVVSGRLAKPDTIHGFILDGFPRTKTQAVALDAELASNGRRLDLALYLSASSNTVVSRLATRLTCPNCDAVFSQLSGIPDGLLNCDKCGNPLEHRSDETPEAIKVRMNAYADLTEPVIEYYRNRGILADVDGNGSVFDVNSAIDSILAASLGTAQPSPVS